jgi:hypothetical protein
MRGLGFGVQGIINQRWGLKKTLHLLASQNGRCHYRKFQNLLNRFCGAIDKKTGHYKEVGDLIEIRFFHSQVHKGFRVLDFRPLKKNNIKAWLKC